MTHHFFRLAITSLILVVFVTAHSQQVVEHSQLSANMSNIERWSSKYTDWHARAKPHPDPSSFVPTKAALSLAVLRNSPAEAEGFTVALFDGDSASKEGIAVDAMGRVVEVAADDYEGIITLAHSVNELPDSGNFRNTWVLKRPTTSQPIDRILVAVKGGELRETSVQGFSKTLSTELKHPVGDEEITHLPPALFELAGLVLEGRKDFEPGREDERVVSRVKDILGDVF